MGAIYKYIIFASQLPGPSPPPPPPPSPPPTPPPPTPGPPPIGGGKIPPEKTPVSLEKTRWVTNITSGASPYLKYTLNFISRPALEEK